MPYDDAPTLERPEHGSQPRRWAPTLTILLLAPFLGETFSTASSPIELVMPWALPLVVGMYGGGALLCREIARRYNLSFLGLCLLAVTYGAYEEGLIDRFWFDPEFWEEAGVGSYSVVGELNILLASHLTVFHVGVSICMSIIITEWLFPGRRHEPWVGSRGLALAAFGLLVVVPVFSLQFRVPGLWAFVTAGAILIAAAVLAFQVPRATVQLDSDTSPRRRGVAWVAFAATAAQFSLTYAVPSIGIPWPAGLALSLLPVLIGWVVISRLATTRYLDRDGIRAVSGIAAFFIPLGMVVGLAGRFDLTIGALIAGILFLRMNRLQRLRDRHAAESLSRE